MKKKSVIRVDFSYNGTHFSGYQKQIQKNIRTVQQEIEHVLKLIYKKPITVYCAGRTDAGVHALHQVISFKPPQEITLSPQSIKKALNALLAKDIRVTDVIKESDKFHARFSPKKRTYLYMLHTGEECSPFEYDKVWHCPYTINLAKLKKTLQEFLGEHNFKSFCEKADSNTYIRTLYSIKVKRKKNLIYIYIAGNAFLRRMIRIIIGTAIGIASRNDINPSFIKTIFKLEERSKNPFPTAPPQGLYFYRVEF